VFTQQQQQKKLFTKNDREKARCR